MHRKPSRRKKWPVPEELHKLNLRSHDEFGQMQPLWFLQDLQATLGLPPWRETTKPLQVVPVSDEELARLYPDLSRIAPKKKKVVAKKQLNTTAREATPRKKRRKKT